jgi:hypothetical protein
MLELNKTILGDKRMESKATLNAEPPPTHDVNLDASGLAPASWPLSPPFHLAQTLKPTVNKKQSNPTAHHPDKPTLPIIVAKCQR